MPDGGIHNNMDMNMKHKSLLGALLVALLVLSGCAVTIEKPSLSLTKISAGEYPLFVDDLDIETLETAIGESLEYYARLPEDRIVFFGTDSFTVGELKESLVEFAAIMKSAESPKTRNRRLRKSFDVYRASGNDGEGTVLFTGYYAPILKGSLSRDSVYRYPIYRTPPDHIVINLEMFHSKFKGERVVARYEDGTVMPYYTREDIDAKGVLDGEGLEIAWLSDPVDLFFLHIQGSGIIHLADGRLIRVSYERSNGHPYRSIGRYLVDRGKVSLEDISLKSIKKYLNRHPEEVPEVLNYNKSYVFFRIVEEGPVGSLNVPVTPGRTIATDSIRFPKGALAFIRTKKPSVDENGRIVSWSSFSRFVLNQDTGGAIKGPGRVDLFCGSGMYAETMAGHLKETGELYFLVKRKPEN